MPANVTPIFTLKPKHAMASIATANTNRDGTGTIDTVYTAGADDSRIEMIRVVASEATTAGVVRIYVYDGAVYFMIKEILVTAITPSTTIEVFTAEWIPSVPLNLQSGQSLRASTHNAETFKIHIEAGDY